MKEKRILVIVGIVVFIALNIVGFSVYQNINVSETKENKVVAMETNENVEKVVNKEVKQKNTEEIEATKEDVEIVDDIKEVEEKFEQNSSKLDVKSNEVTKTNNENNKKKTEDSYTVSNVQNVKIENEKTNNNIDKENNQKTNNNMDKENNQKTNNNINKTENEEISNFTIYEIGYDAPLAGGYARSYYYVEVDMKNKVATTKNYYEVFEGVWNSLSEEDKEFEGERVKNTIVKVTNLTNDQVNQLTNIYKKYSDNLEKYTNISEEDVYEYGENLKAMVNNNELEYDYYTYFAIDLSEDRVFVYDNLDEIKLLKEFFKIFE